MSQPTPLHTFSRILVCGGRDYRDRERLAEVFGYTDRFTARDMTIIQGGAKGADAMARELADLCAWRVETYKADWEAHGKFAGPIRNQQMIDEGKPDVVIAFPGGRGTADMVRRAREAGVPVVEVES